MASYSVQLVVEDIPRGWCQGQFLLVYIHGTGEGGIIASLSVQVRLEGGLETEFVNACGMVIRTDTDGCIVGSLLRPSGSELIL